LPPDSWFAFGLLDLVPQVTFQRRAGPAAAAQGQHGALCPVFQQERQPAVQGERDQRYSEPPRCLLQSRSADGRLVQGGEQEPAGAEQQQDAEQGLGPQCAGRQHEHYRGQRDQEDAQRGAGTAGRQSQHGQRL
jgi:hypothetical protein